MPLELIRLRIKVPHRPAGDTAPLQPGPGQRLGGGEAERLHHHCFLDAPLLRWSPRGHRSMAGSFSSGTRMFRPPYESSMAAHVVGCPRRLPAGALCGRRPLFQGDAAGTAAEASHGPLFASSCSGTASRPELPQIRFDRFPFCSTASKAPPRLVNQRSAAVRDQRKRADVATCTRDVPDDAGLRVPCSSRHSMTPSSSAHLEHRPN